MICSAEDYRLEYGHERNLRIKRKVPGIFWMMCSRMAPSSDLWPGRQGILIVKRIAAKSKMATMFLRIHDA
jgi:hypothetical protein